MITKKPNFRCVYGNEYSFDKASVTMYAVYNNEWYIAVKVLLIAKVVYLAAYNRYTNTVTGLYMNGSGVLQRLTYDMVYHESMETGDVSQEHYAKIVQMLNCDDIYEQITNGIALTALKDF